MLTYFIRFIEYSIVIGKRCWRSFVSMGDHDIFPLSSHVAFMLLLAIFPFLLFVSALASFLGNPLMSKQIVFTILQVLPADVVSTINPAVVALLDQRNINLLTFGVLISLWTASSAVEAIRMVLNLAYGGVDNRSVVTKKIESILIVVIGAACLLGISLLLIKGPYLVKSISNAIELTPRLKTQLKITRWIGASVAVTAGLFFIHRYLPVNRPRMSQVVGGVFATLMIILIGAGIISYYFGEFNNISTTYGSFAGVIITLLFFYLTALALGFGAEFNATEPSFKRRN
ncbi:MAG: YihY/virulence factor BrkB family protein [Candidatus Pacebacteria bacterium]|nr:YihY/virulence factor BrkB family protein [Candidatus Paceibacterota bacterium]